jgi:S1-C subfamily serine protease
MTGLDWIILAFAGVLGVFGFRQGFIVGVLSFGGFVTGAFLGTRLGPLLLPRGADSPYAPAFGLIGALVAGAVLATGLEGLGLRLRRTLIAGLSFFDGVLGALLSAAIALGIVWIAAAVVAQIPGQSQLRADIQRSVILGELNQLLPPSGPVLGALARLDPIPQIAGLSPGVAPPPLARSLDTPAVRAAGRSVVRILGTACGLAIEGSGWVAAPDVVVTNAHVLAGEHDTTVEVGGDQPTLPAQAIAFDPTDDVAVLRVPELGLEPLRLASQAPSETAGVILGYPENGPFDAQAARIGQTQTVLTDNAYGEGPIRRLLTPLRGLVRPGNSGGPLISTAGEVLTTVFAGTTGGGPHGGYGVANTTVARVLAGARTAVGTGHCVE